MQIDAALCRSAGSDGTPDDGALRYAPHRLYGVIDGAERASVGSWLAMAAEAMAARAAGKLPIIIGGTGMYINAGLNGLATIQDVPMDIHASCVAQLAKWAVMRFGRSWQIRPGCRQRCLPVTASAWSGRWAWCGRREGRCPSGRPIRIPASSDGTALSVALVPPRANLYDRINQRFDEMLAAGALMRCPGSLPEGLMPGCQ